MAKQSLIIIGNGMAGIRTLEEIQKRAPDLYSVTVFGAEPHVNYNRILLSPVLAGEKTFDDIVLNGRDWYSQHGVELIAGEKVVSIDRDTKTVTGEKGTVRSYDRLLLATGSNPFLLPVPGANLPGVIAFRDIGDVDTMLAAARDHRHAVVIGGGLLGLEAAAGLKINGMDVTVIHLPDTLMERQLDASAAHLLAADLENRGIQVITGANTKELVGTDRVQALRLVDGREIPADLVVMAVGIRPNADLARASGLVCGRGVQVDDGLVTSDPAISAIGECVEHRGQTYGLVAPIWDMAKVCADHLTGKTDSAYEGTVTGTRLKVTGIDMFSAGEFSGASDTHDVVFRDAARGVYKRVVLRDDKVVGTVLYGDARDGNWYFRLMREAQPLGNLRDLVVFGEALASQGSDVTANPKPAVASLPDDAEICGCNGVCKGTIVKAIHEQGLTTLDAVRAQTKASASCGSCTSLVEQLLACELGEGFQQVDVKPMCKCTEHDHDFVRKAIVERGLKNIPAVMQQLGWKTPDGCASCRPALNYYLLCAWPGEYSDDAQSRFINERSHANIQKDGTYSVVPRMWGGLTNPKELRAIADVAEKYNVPMVKVTGGQRIDLFGIRKEDLHGVWADLNAAGMVSGHAYGKSLRTVKTCVGSEWCRFGTQDSTGLGVKLEQLTWGSWHPHKVKLAVSGCPRNCAEATIKDFGVICVDSGYELHIGGNGGIHVRATDLLVKVNTEEEVMEYCGAFLQLYREEARYLERTAPWLERVGLDHIKAKIVADADNRKALNERFLLSQSHSQFDPWAAEIAASGPNQYQPLAELEV